MTAALEASVLSKPQGQGSQQLGRTGAFAAACFSHTSFYSSYPFIADPASSSLTANFVGAFADWLYGRGQYSTAFLLDDCCSASEDDVAFNPTCPPM
jgi:hypothetical protein